MNKKTNIIISSILSLLFIVSLFLPIMSLSFGIELNGIMGLAANSFRIILSESYLEYLGVMSTIFTPILLLILIIWSFRQQLKIIPLSILSLMTILGGVSWLFKYGRLDILLFGYYFWLVLILTVIGFNFFKLSKQENVQT